MAARLQLFRNGAPDARLPDAGLPLERDDRRQGRERAACGVQFLVSPDQVTRHACSIPPLRKKRYTLRDSCHVACYSDKRAFDAAGNEW